MFDQPLCQTAFHLMMRENQPVKQGKQSSWSAQDAKEVFYPIQSFCKFFFMLSCEYVVNPALHIQACVSDMPILTNRCNFQARMHEKHLICSHEHMCVAGKPQCPCGCFNAWLTGNGLPI